MAKHDAPAASSAANPPVIALGKAIAWLREQRRMSQADLAAAVGISQPTLSRFERGDGQPNALTMRRLADALGISVDDLHARVEEALKRAERLSKDALSKATKTVDSTWNGLGAVVGTLGIVALIAFAIAAVFGESRTGGGK
jgi:transcriptional regulator with XRE-family HTH domain